jgi:signal transduction histidine kinase/ligand-binding sensor domain-containing protein/DNA-binding response OmpR family regulator
MNNRYVLHLLFFLISNIFQTISHSQQQTISFQNYTTRNGLSANKINAVLQDKLGFLWFATEDGLNRFDGYEFKIYRNDPNDSTSITSNDIWSLLEDYDGNIWIGTKTGELNRYNFKTDNFSSWNIDPNDGEENGITCIFRDRDKNLWIGTYRNGLYIFNPANNSFRNWKYNHKDKNSLSNNFITGIIQDYIGNLWISTYNGLNKFNPRISDKTFTKFYYQPDNTESISNNLIWSLIDSEFFNNEIWICTAAGLSRINVNDNTIKRITLPVDKALPFGNSISSIQEDILDDEKLLWLGSYGGLIKYNLKTGKSERYISNETQSGQLVSNQINELFKDRSGVFWIITENGISRWSSKTAKFNPLYVSGQNFENISRLNKKNVNALQQSNDGNLWIGTSDGLYTVTYLNNYALIKKYPELDGKNIWALKLGSANSLWIGTYGQGLFRFDLSTHRVYPVEIKSPTFETSAYKYVKSIFEDEEQNIWVGFWGGGLCRLKAENYEIWINENNNKNSLSHNDVWSIHQDKSGRLWIGTNGGGLNLIEKSGALKFHRIVRGSEADKSLSSNVIYSIMEAAHNKSDNETVLWIGTSAGLNKLTISNSYKDYKDLLSNIKVKHFTTRDGLPENIIKSVVEDSDGNLWISTNSGLSKFNLETNTFSNYNSTDGIKNLEFNSGAAIKLNNGLSFFGGTGGIDFFYGKNIIQSDYMPPIVVTDFLIFNEKVNIGTDTPLPVNISAAEKIILPYSQNVFSFQFAALDYNSPNSIEYAYMMEGFDNDWIQSKNNRTATYTNLNPGNYTFKVKATNSDGFWVEVPASISITIDSPWWRTYWAYAAYTLIIIAGLYLIRKTELNRSRLRNELKVRELEAEKLKEIEKIKSRFFANLSHEFRTPLMLIKGPAEQLASGRDVDKVEQIKLIQRNSEKLQTLIDQLLELTQLEAGSLLLKAKKENIVSLAKGIFYSFCSLAEQKNIKLDFVSFSEKISAWIDADKFEKILNNLLSNAFKFTADGGKISLNILEHNSVNGENILLTINDTGIGIPENKLHRVFDRFYQVDDSTKRPYGGSGIGLALVKELVDLHKWQISVESEVGRGTQFCVIIPTSDSYLDENQKVIADSEILKADDSSGSTEIFQNVEINRIDKFNAEKSQTHEQKNRGSTILIVEDSEDVRIYLTDLLKADYNILLAENGEKGLSVALDKLPDLIISDVMMPEMDGMEFCKRIKSDWQTSHIPVILLTAKASFESKIEGLETGADDYLTKPFSFRELSVRIKNLLEQRLKLQQKFGKDSKLKIENITPNKADQEFLQKAIRVVEGNLSNTEFDSDKFAGEIFLSRSQLHRKLHSITGQSTGEFIRTIRLKKAAGLLLEKELAVTQIAFEVGFNSPSHFTKAFRQMFNCLPSEFVNKSNS